MSACSKIITNNYELDRRVYVGIFQSIVFSSDVFEERLRFP